MKVSNGKKYSNAQQREPVPKLPGNLAELQATVRGRLLAQAYARNGAKFTAASTEVMGSRETELRAFGETAKDAFYEELDRILSKADIDKDAALRVLWQITTASIIDFLDDAGEVLPLAELRKLPRELQCVLDTIEVKRSYVPVRGGDGEYIFDPRTHKPVLAPSVTCKIKMPEKTKAINTLASILHWIETRPQVTVNIAQIMKAADERADQMRTVNTDRTAGVPSTGQLDHRPARNADDAPDHVLPEDQERADLSDE